MSITKVQPSLFSPIHQLLYAAEMAQAHNWPDATTKCFWSTTERTARQGPISCRATRRSSGKAFSPRPITRHWLRLSDLPGLSVWGALGPISVGLRGVPAGRQKQYGHSRPENANRLLRQDCSVLSGGRRSCRLWDAGRGDDYRAGSGCMVAAVGRGAVADGQRSLIRAALRSGQSDIVRVGESDRQNGLHGIFFRIS